jgi:hypothetical protein
MAAILDSCRRSVIPFLRFLTFRKVTGFKRRAIAETFVPLPNPTST